MKGINDLKIKIFADGADMNSIVNLYGKGYIRGFTTNPTLMYKAGITDYYAFARSLLELVHDYPVSFEVFSDDLPKMELQALEIASWGPNVYVKIPITNTKGVSTAPIIAALSHSGVKINVTAMMTISQVDKILHCVKEGAPTYFSIFAGRIADTGVDPIPVVREIIKKVREYPNVEVIWASPREVLNVFQADRIGCHIITVTNDILNKLDLFGKDLEKYSLETVHMFYQDAMKAGFSIQLARLIDPWSIFVNPGRRSEYRVDVRIPCWIAIRGGERIGTRTINLSPRGALLENELLHLRVGQSLRLGLKFDGQTQEIVREGTVTWANNEKVSIGLNTTPEQQDLIDQGLMTHLSKQEMKASDRRKSELRLPLQTTCKVFYKDDPIGELLCKDISPSGLRLVDVPNNWQNDDVFIEIHLPDLSTICSVSGSTCWHNGSDVGIQIKINSSEYLRYCQEFAEQGKSKQIPFNDLHPLPVEFSKIT
jgi:transaldolase